MSDVTVDRLVVLIEAQTRSFELQIKRLEGQVSGSARRMSTSFRGLSTQFRDTGSVLGRAFGIGAVGRAGVAGAMAATVYAIGRAAHAMSDLSAESKKTGIAIDEAFSDKAKKFSEDFDTIPDRLKVVFAKVISGDYTVGDFFSGKIKTDLQPQTTQHSMIAAKGDLQPINNPVWDQVEEDLKLLDKSLAKLRDSANEAAQGMTDSVQSFTHALIDNPKDWSAALTNMLKGVSTDIVDAGLFGSGPYAKLMGTAGPSGGGPGGLIGDAFGSLLGGGRDFGKPVPVEIVGVSGQGTISQIFAGGGKDQSRIDALGNVLPPGVMGWPGLGGAPSAAAASAGNSFLDMISKAEGTAGPNGYNTSLGYGKFLPGGVEQNLTSMTLDQIRGLQTGMLNNPANTFNSSAIGRYQITRSTLDDLRTKLGLSGSELYDPAMQDALALNLAQQRGTAGLTSTWSGLGQQSPGFLAQLLAMFPHFARGGSFSAGRPFIAGERGPEMIVPRAPGTVIPNGGGMGGVTLIDKRVNAPAIKQGRDESGRPTFTIADHDRLMRDRYGIKPTQIGRT